MKQKQLLFIMTGFFLGFGLGDILFIVQTDLHYFHQSFTLEYANIISFIIMIPIIEEVSKRLMVYISEELAAEKSYLIVLAVAYGFQVREAMFHNWVHDYWLRFIIPLHLLFTLISARVGLRYGIATHAIWNSQSSLPVHNLIQVGFIFVSYIFFFYVLSLVREQEIKSREIGSKQ